MMATRRILSGADIVLPDRVVSGGSVVIEDGRVVDVAPRALPASGDGWQDVTGAVIVPGFVDVHVHGVDGIDGQDGPAAVSTIARRMPTYGVTAFAPTTVACAPDELHMVVQAVRACREKPEPGSARVLPAHLESNFVSREYKGAQPAACLRSPAAALAGEPARAGEVFSGADILRVIDAAGPDIGIVTLAPELDQAIALIARLVATGRIVSLGHSGASFDVGLEAIRAGARQATHLFNRMPPLGHREPGLAGAVLPASVLSARNAPCSRTVMSRPPSFVTVPGRSPAPALPSVMAITRSTPFAAMAVRSMPGWTWKPSHTSSAETSGDCSTAPARPGSRWPSCGMRLNRCVA